MMRNWCIALLVVFTGTACDATTALPEDTSACHAGAYRLADGEAIDEGVLAEARTVAVARLVGHAGSARAEKTQPRTRCGRREQAAPRRGEARPL